MTLLHVSMLGELTASAADGLALDFPTRKTRALLAYLAAAPGRRHARDKVAGLLWPDKPEAAARANLRKTLSRLQSALPGQAGESMASDASGISLRPDTTATDLELFTQLMANGTPESLERALSLYRGPFLDGLTDCGDAFEEWLAAERRRHEESVQQLMRRLLDHYVVTGAIEPAIQLALKLLTIDGLDEEVHRTLIRLYTYQDRIGAALEQYRRCRDLLAGELGVDPSPETRRLRDEIAGLVPDGGKRDPPPREVDDLPERKSVIESAAAFRRRQRAKFDLHPSIAVLVFHIEEDEPAHRHVVSGIAEDIATELGRFRELTIIAPATMLAYRHAAAAPESIGDELGVDYVLAGSLRVRGNQARIGARLVESASARQVWSEHYDCALEGIFEVQDEVVGRIVGSLCSSVEHDRLAQARCKRPDDWQTYDLWLRGWTALRRPELSSIHEARRYFQQAVARDPNYARAYVGLALAHLNEWACYAWNHWTFLQREALELARKAVALDGRDHRARCMLALAELYGGRYDAARSELLAALELNPNDADVLAHASFAMALIGERDKGLEAGRKALRLAPYHPDWYAGMAGIAFFTAHRYQEAIDTMSLAPEAFCNTPAFIAASYAHLGQPQEGASHRDTVYRHYRYQMSRGGFPGNFNCIDWLTALDPYQNPEDVEHYVDGLRKAGFSDPHSRSA